VIYSICLLHGFRRKEYDDFCVDSGARDGGDGAGASEVFRCDMRDGKGRAEGDGMAYQRREDLPRRIGLSWIL
jgi:hypothetical protein